MTSFIHLLWEWRSLLCALFTSVVEQPGVRLSPRTWNLPLASTPCVHLPRDGLLTIFLEHLLCFVLSEPGLASYPENKGLFLRDLQEEEKHPVGLVCSRKMPGWPHYHHLSRPPTACVPSWSCFSLFSSSWRTAGSITFVRTHLPCPLSFTSK